MWRHLVIAWVLAFLCAPGIAGLLGVRASAFENRALAPFPEWSARSWLDAEAYAALSAWLSDRLPLRAEGVAADAWIDLVLLGDSPSDEVLVGSDGELFLTGSLVWSCMWAAEPERIVAILDRIGAALAGRGAQLYVVFSPSKAFLEADRLPARGRRLNGCVGERRAALRERLARAPGLHFVDVWSAFEAEREAGERLFPQRGRHWDSHAAVVQTRETVRALDPRLWDPRFVVEDAPQRSMSELPLRFMNLRIPQLSSVHAIEREGVDVVAENSRFSPRSTYEMSHTRARSSGPALLPGRTVVVWDSFIAPAVEWLAQFFERATFVHWDEFGYRPWDAARLLQGADRVVLQVVEDRRGFSLTDKTARAVERAVAPRRARP
jgi:hypothetical protein